MKQKMHDTSSEYCLKCFFSNSSSGVVCDRYVMLGEGYRRECPPGKCDKFLRKNPTEEEIDANRRLNNLAHHSKEKAEKANAIYRNFLIGKGKNKRGKG